MTIKKAKMIEKIIKEIEQDGHSSRESYTYEFGKYGEIVKHPVHSVYATSEEVAQVRKQMEIRNW